MVFDNLCSKIYFWPFLSYLAGLKGLCPFYPPGYLTTTTLTPIPTFQPTPPTTLPPCPADPLVCLSGGEPPIPYCPCIDPRNQNGQTAGTEVTGNLPVENLQLKLDVPPATYVPATTGNIMIFSHLDSMKRRRKRKKRQDLERTSEK